MASVSSTNSLGNTSLRGYGGMASGIDRDAIIEQMTAGTNTKITNQESAITKLEWKQEAYRGISDKILDLYDNYCSYTSTNSLKDPNSFAKSLISVLGKEESTRFVTASGTSELVNNVSVQAVRQLASSSVQMSEKRQDKALTMALKELGGKAASYSNLAGAELTFVDEDGKKVGTFTFGTTYTDENGDTKSINYFSEDYAELEKQFNKMLQDSSTKLGDTELKDAFEFKYEDGQMKMVQKGSGLGSYTIRGDSTALTGLGYKGSKTSEDTVTLNQYNSNLGDFEKSATTKVNIISYLRDENLTFNYDGSSKDIKLITSEEANELLNMGFDDEDTTLADILGGQDKLDALRAEITAAIRSEEEKGAEEDAVNQIKIDIREGIGEKIVKDLGAKAAQDLGYDGEDWEKLDKEDLAKVNEEIGRQLSEKSLNVRIQEALAADPSARPTAEVKAEIEKELEDEIQEELSKISGWDDLTEEQKQAEHDRLLEAKTKEMSIDDRVLERQAEEVFDKKVEEQKNDPSFAEKKEAALQKRVAQRLEEKSMTARITEEATVAQQDQISKALNHKRLETIKDNVQQRLNKAFGTGNVTVDIEGENLTFKTKKPDSSISVSSKDGGVLWSLGISDGESNKINTSGTLKQSSLGIDINDEDYSDGLVINGVTIGGINENTSISSILSKINSSDAGVKATYVAASGQFMLVSEETGAGREISLDSKLARDLFGRSGVTDDSTISSMGLWNKEGDSGTLEINGVSIAVNKTDKITDVLNSINTNEDPRLTGVTAEFDEESRSFVLKQGDKDVTADFVAGDEAKAFFANRSEQYQVKGKDAIIDVSYGNGVTVSMERASNTFDLEGMTVTVSGVFGGEYVGEGENKTWKADTSAGVTFSAKADVDKVTEKVKKFFEDFNAIVTEVNTQVTTRPDSSYGPLTDEQKDEMNETSIENWEKKAKSGLLFNDSTMRDLSMDIQSVYTKLMRQTGLSYEDLKELGISYSDNEKDGGVLVFDETAFRSAMENKPEKVSALFTGGSGMGDGLVKIVEDTFTPYATRYATRNGNSYGRLIEEAGSEKIPTSLMKNQIYNEIKSKQELIEELRSKLKTEQDRYISMFTTMETMINQMNSQASYLSQITG